METCPVCGKPDIKDKRGRHEMDIKVIEDIPVLSLPSEELQEILNFYHAERKVHKRDVPVVLIYNVKQLAAEIAKCLKEGSNNG